MQQLKLTRLKGNVTREKERTNFPILDRNNKFIEVSIEEFCIKLRYFLLQLRQYISNISIVFSFLLLKAQRLTLEYTQVPKESATRIQI